VDSFTEITHIPSYADMRSDLRVTCQMCFRYKQAQITRLVFKAQ